MKNECSIVRDLLPLYAEHMLSDDTTMFVCDHLKQCPACTAAYEELKKAAPSVDDEDTTRREAEKNALIAVKKKVRSRSRTVAVILAACLAALVLLLQTFPVYRLVQVGWALDYYKKDEVAMLLYAGSPFDRAAVQPILRMADGAFRDFSHTDAELDALHGKLSRYATPTDHYAGVVTVDYSLKLWSAHLDGDRGYLWVYYSRQAYDSRGSTVTGSKNIPAFWEVEKDATGTWQVVRIKEHP